MKIAEMTQKCLLSCLAVLLLAWGSGCSGSDTKTDTGVRDQATSPPDLISDRGPDVNSPRWLPDLGMPGCDGGGCSRREFVVSRIIIPTTITEVMAYARDIDQDSDWDNEVGLTLATFSSTTPFIKVQEIFDDTIKDGIALTLLRLLLSSPTKGPCSGQLYAGQDPDGDPSDNLSGTETLDVDASAFSGDPMPGTLANDKLVVAGGTQPLVLPPAAASLMHLHSAQVTATISPDGLTGVIAGGFPVKDVDEVLIPACVDFLNKFLEDPSAKEKDRQMLLLLLDSDKSGKLTWEEFANSTFVVDNLRKPDLDLLDASGKPGQDGKNDSISVGLGFEAVPCTINAP